VAETATAGWLLLIHQIPPKPDYLRVKIWRRLQGLGAVPIKNSVYVLPNNEQAQEDFQWVLREIVELGGDGSVCEARFVEGLATDQLQTLFNTARDADYRKLVKDARTIAKRLDAGKRTTPEVVKAVTAPLARIAKRLSEVAAIDFFGAPERQTLEELVTNIEERLRTASQAKKRSNRAQRYETKPAGATWVTRTGIHVDRMASAWLIRRFIDPKATFKFVAAKGYRPKRGELRFDMFDAEFTHDGDRCTFEVLLTRFGLVEPALQSIAEIVHDIDLKEEKFGRDETPGVERLIAGICMGNKDDEARASASRTIWEALYEYFRRKRA